MQLHAVLLFPRHDGQLGGHGLEAVPGMLVLWGRLVLEVAGGSKGIEVQIRSILNRVRWTRRILCENSLQSSKGIHS